MVKQVFDALSGCDSLECIKTVLVDNTSVKTGWKDGRLSYEIRKKMSTKFAYGQTCFRLKQAIIRPRSKN